MKTRLSEIEQLRIEKMQLMQDCRMYEEELSYKVGYAKSNFGHLLANTFVSSAKTGFSELISPFFGKKNKQEELPRKSSSGVGQLFIAASPLVWEILQPVLIGIAVKKMKSVFFKKSKK